MDKKYMVQFRPLQDDEVLPLKTSELGDGWELVGYYDEGEMDRKVQLYNSVDQKRGHVMTVDNRTGKVLFMRETAVTPKPDSSDCHTYSY